jgi:hypothetical protein
VGASYVDSKVLGYYVSSRPVGGGATNTIDICGEGFSLTPKSRVDANAEYDYPMLVIGPALSWWARLTQALRKPPSDSRFALLSEHGGSLVDSFGRSEMSERR